MAAIITYNEIIGAAQHIVYLAIDKVTQGVVGAISFFLERPSADEVSVDTYTSDLKLYVDFLDAGIKSLGIGTKLMTRAIWHAMRGGLRTIALDSVPESVHFYKGLGFAWAKVDSFDEEDDWLLKLHVSRQPKPLLSWKQLTGTSPFFKVIQLLRSKRYLT